MPKAVCVLAVHESHACLCASAGAQVGEAKGISKGGTSEAWRQCFSICFPKPTCLCISTTLKCVSKETNAVGCYFAYFQVMCQSYYRLIVCGVRSEVVPVTGVGDESFCAAGTCTCCYKRRIFSSSGSFGFKEQMTDCAETMARQQKDRNCCIVFTSSCAHGITAPSLCGAVIYTLILTFVVWSVWHQQL